MFKAMFNTGRLAYGLADRLFFKAAWGEFNNCQLENQNTQLSYRRLTSECEEVVTVPCICPVLGRSETLYLSQLTGSLPHCCIAQPVLSMQVTALHSQQVSAIC